jgi:hypothetical protein
MAAGSKKSVRAVPYREGDWFSVPLLEGGYGALGLVARVAAPPSGVFLGYFFEPMPIEVLEQVDRTTLQPSDARIVSRASDLALMSKGWAVLGHDPGWNRLEWPIPVIQSDAFGGGSAYITFDGPSLHDKLVLDFDARAQPFRADAPRIEVAGHILIEELLGDLVHGVRVEPSVTRTSRSEESMSTINSTHYLYFQDMRSAEAAQKSLGPDFPSEVDPESRYDDTYLLEVTFDYPAKSPELFEAVEKRLQSCAVEFGGEYDGYDQGALP